MNAFIAELIVGVSKNFGELGQYQLTTAEWDAVFQLAEEKYRSWEWNIGRSPEFTVTHKVTLDTTDVEIQIRVIHAIIEAVEFAENQPNSKMITKNTQPLSVNATTPRTWISGSDNYFCIPFLSFQSACFEKQDLYKNSALCNIFF